MNKKMNRNMSNGSKQKGIPRTMPRNVTFSMQKCRSKIHTVKTEADLAFCMLFDK